MLKYCKARKMAKAKPGQVVIELIVGLIMFTILVALIMSMSTYLYFQQALVTAAREGARQASLNSSLGAATTEQSGITNIQSYTSNVVLNLTGQQATSSNATITVTPPSQSVDQTIGNRTVTVAIAWQMTNPVGIADLLKALGAKGTDALKTIPVSASATMRYEE